MAETPIEIKLTPKVLQCVRLVSDALKPLNLDAAKQPDNLVLKEAIRLLTQEALTSCMREEAKFETITAPPLSKLPRARESRDGG